MVPELICSTKPFNPNEEGSIALQFRERGFAVVGGVFERDSVDAYRKQVESLVRPNDQWYCPYVLDMNDLVSVWPAKAPRLIAALSGTFSWGRRLSLPVLVQPSWLIRPSNPSQKQVHDWHKDFDHEGLGNLGADGYTYPTIVHANMYFEDMTEAHGPTFVIPGSHRDRHLSPYRGAEKLEKPLICGKGDVVLWDQRMWHRGSARTVEGLRIVAIFAFISTPLSNRARVSAGQREAMKLAESPQEKVMFGGPLDLD